MENILLVEDDRQLSKLLNLHFSDKDFAVTSSYCGEDALKQIQERTFQVLLLDIMLPGINGIEVCKKIRLTNKRLPIMVLTSLGDEQDKILALELGADDYMTKPFSIPELIARTKALLRRSAIASLGQSEIPKDSIDFKGIHMDRVQTKVTIRGKRVELTPKEFDVLALLAANPGKTFTRQQLLQEIWGFAFLSYEHTVTAHINRLRIKIEQDLHSPEYILTSWGTGYRFAE